MCREEIVLELSAQLGIVDTPSPELVALDVHCLEEPIGKEKIKYATAVRPDGTTESHDRTGGCWWEDRESGDGLPHEWQYLLPRLLCRSVEARSVEEHPLWWVERCGRIRDPENENGLPIQGRHVPVHLKIVLMVRGITLQTT